MLLAEVVTNLVATVKHKSFSGRRILVIQPVDQEGKKVGQTMLAFDDDIKAGPGDRVLVCREGNGCRQIWADSMAPVNSVIVGIVD